MEPADGLIVIQERLDLEDVGRLVSGPSRALRPRRRLHERGGRLPRPAEGVLRPLYPFRDSGRRFYAHVALGNDAPPAIREEAWTILDRLEIRADGASSPFDLRALATLSNLLARRPPDCGRPSRRRAAPIRAA